MSNNIRKLVLASSILATAIVLVFFQIPILAVYGLSVDFSLVPILLGRRYIGFWYSFLIMFIYPWFSITSVSGGGLIGPMFLVLQGLGVLTIDYLLNRNGYSWFGIIGSVILITLWSAILNVFLIGPMWDYLGLEPGESFIYLQSAPVWLIVSILFNPIKFAIVYAVTWPIWIGFENSINQEPNY